MIDRHGLRIQALESSTFHGLVEFEDTRFVEKAIQEWTKELLLACSSPREASSSLISLQKKRNEVQHHIHQSFKPDLIRKADKVRWKKVRLTFEGHFLLSF